ncbi:MAG: hypothetical protein O3C40_07005 [Planctomycetota bacterium]|nr:hypothetical protein [Planctomycetota bacterium]
MDLESLYPLVTESIRRAEILEDLRAPGACAAHLDVSLIEEQIAELLPASDAEGAVARKGAVRAALAATDFARAQTLTARFTAEQGVGAELKAELTNLAQEAARVMTERERSIAACYPRVSARYGIDEIRRLVKALIQQATPFPIG